eukprot:1178761-Prorocentrum_minimum.AAC.4
MVDSTVTVSSPICRPYVRSIRSALVSDTARIQRPSDPARPASEGEGDPTHLSACAPSATDGTVTSTSKSAAYVVVAPATSRMDTSPSHVCSLALHCPDPASTTQMLPLAQVSRIPLQLSSKVPSHIAVRRRRRRGSVVGADVTCAYKMGPWNQYYDTIGQKVPLPVTRSTRNSRAGGISSVRLYLGFSFDGIRRLLVRRGAFVSFAPTVATFHQPCRVTSTSSFVRFCGATNNAFFTPSDGARHPGG